MVEKTKKIMKNSIQNNRKEFEVIVFDLGGVLIELQGNPVVWQGDSVQNQNEKELWKKWLTSPSVRKFESGKIEADQFAIDIVREMGLSMKPKAFLDAFTHWPKGLYPGVKKLLAHLKQEYTLAVLSNTNCVHWPRFLYELELNQLFDYQFPSHLTGFLKPDSGSFKNIVQKLSCEPSHILFLDDNNLNVLGARKAGLQAEQVSELNGVVDLLKQICILPTTF